MSELYSLSDLGRERGLIMETRHGYRVALSSNGPGIGYWPFFFTRSMGRPGLRRPGRVASRVRMLKRSPGAMK